MNELNVNSIVTMSSLEIAELTTKEHRNLLADIRNMLTALKIEDAKFSAPFKMPSGQNTTVYRLPKSEALILVSGYDTQLRAKVIDRWQELENSLQPKLPTTYLEALKELIIKER